MDTLQEVLAQFSEAEIVAYINRNLKPGYQRSARIMLDSDYFVTEQKGLTHAEADWTAFIRFNKDTGDIEVWNTKAGGWEITDGEMCESFGRIGHIIVLEYDKTWCEPYAD